MPSFFILLKVQCMCRKTRGDGPEMNKVQNDSLYCQPSYILILHFHVFLSFIQLKKKKKNKNLFVRMKFSLKMFMLALSFY